MRVTMLTRILAVTTAILAAFALTQFNTNGQLRDQIAQSEARAVTQARSLTADSMPGQSAEVQRVTKWLHEFYKSPEGLRRPEGLWIDGHPDYEGMGFWIFDVYVRRRLQGDTEEQARAAIETAIKDTQEWKAKHP